MGMFTEGNEELAASDDEPFDSMEDLLRQRNGWKESAAHFAKGMEYYRGLLDEIGNAIGEQAFICDDGGRSEGVLRAKLPELVRQLVEKANANRTSD